MGLAVVERAVGDDLQRKDMIEPEGAVTARLPSSSRRTPTAWVFEAKYCNEWALFS
jgi:hypothetical protein